MLTAFVIRQVFINHHNKPDSDNGPVLLSEKKGGARGGRKRGTPSCPSSFGVIYRFPVGAGNEVTRRQEIHFSQGHPLLASVPSIHPRIKYGAGSLSRFRYDPCGIYDLRWRGKYLEDILFRVFAVFALTLNPSPVEGEGNILKIYYSGQLFTLFISLFRSILKPTKKISLGGSNGNQRQEYQET